MSFLHPALFALLVPLAALPLVIHLLNRGFPSHFRFPSIELIKQTLAQRSRPHRWRHWILLLLRTAFLLALALAFLRPVLPRFGGDPTDTTARHVLIVLDHSASMEHRGDGPSSRERAVHEARKLIDSLAAEDKVNVLLMQSTPAACFVEFSQDHAEARRFLDALKPGLTRGDVLQSNALAARLLASASSRPEIYYVSDFQRRNWAHVNFTALPPDTRLFFVHVGPTRHGNRALLHARLGQAQLLAGDTVPLEITIGNFSPDPFEDRLVVTVDRHFHFEQDTVIAPWSEATVTVPVSVGGPGLHLCEVTLPPDPLDLDNRLHLTLSVQEKEEVLIITDEPADTRSGAFFLRTALNPFPNESGSLLPRVIGSGDLSASRLAGVNKMFFTQLHRLPEDAVTAVAGFLFRGGGLLYFLDGDTDAENLAALETALQPDVMPIQLTRRRTARQIGSGAQQVVRGDFQSRYLKLFQGEARQNLALLEFYDYYQASSRADGVLLSYTDESPAMAVLHHGRGTLLLLNFSASELSSNLARQRVFPAWMQDLVKAVAATEPPPIAHTIGESLLAEVWRDDLRSADFKGPSGTTVPVRRLPDGERYGVAFTPDHLGFYTLGEPRPILAFGINGSPEEADLRPLDPEVLPKEFAAERPAHFVAGADAFAELAAGRPLFHWFILGAVGLLLLEGAFQASLRRKPA
jgi:hypothetical protein